MENNHDNFKGQDSSPTEMTKAQKGFQELAEGAKALSSSGFESRHKDIVDSSFEKARNNGEKQIGETASERRNAAYLNRISGLVEKHGDRAEKRLWQESAKKLIVQPENIPESYWKQQEQILRDSGHGDQHLGDYERQTITKELQRHQAESLQSWSNYLGSEDSPYPMWFKVYAWDGMSKMGVFDKEKRRFSKRDKSTVAPYPKCNPAVIAKVFNAIERHYGRSDKERFEESDERDREMEELAKTSNFNALYSKILLTEKAIPKTPEKPEDVHGEWVEYLPGQEKELANAAEGTPWCVADPSTGRSYLEYGEYGHGDEYGEFSDYDDSENKAKFILFHLYDPETNTLAENACASIRIDTDGDVVEISGLNEGQALEDSLVSTVEEKVKSLPGGEHFLKAFADKKELIELDRKMQNNEPLTKEEYEFLYEINRPIETLDTYNDDDPRIEELKEKYDIADYLKMDNVDLTNNLLAVLVDTLDENCGEWGVIELADYNKVREFLTAGVDPASFANALIEKNHELGIEVISDNLDNFLAAGADPAGLANVLIRERTDAGMKLVLDNLSQFFAAGVDPTSLADALIRDGGVWGKQSVSDSLDEFLAAGVDLDWLRSEGVEVPENQ